MKKLDSFWYRIIKGGEEGNFGQHPGCGPGDLLFKSDNSKYFRLEKSNYCVEADQVEVEPVSLDELEVWHVLKTLSRKKLTDNKENLKKVYPLLPCFELLLIGSHVRWNRKTYYVHEMDRRGTIYLSRRGMKELKDRIRVQDYDFKKSGRLLSKREMNRLIDRNNSNVYSSLRSIPINGVDSATIRQIFSIATGERLKVPVRLIDAKGFMLDIMEYLEDKIMYVAQQIMPTKDDFGAAFFFKKTGEKKDGREIYKEI